MIYGFIFQFIGPAAIIILQFYTAIYAKNRLNDSSSNFMLIGTVMCLIGTITSLLIQYIIIPQLASPDYSKIPFYYMTSNILSSGGLILFLVGLSNLLRQLFWQIEDQNRAN